MINVIITALSYTEVYTFKSLGGGKNEGRRVESDRSVDVKHSVSCSRRHPSLHRRSEAGDTNSRPWVSLRTRGRDADGIHHTLLPRSNNQFGSISASVVGEGGTIPAGCLVQHVLHSLR